jgi:hypothetical protein
VTGAHQAALAVALAAPLVAVGFAVSRPSRLPLPTTAFLGGAATVAALAWAYLVAVGADGEAGPFHISALEAAAGCGAALSMAAVVPGLTGRRAAVGAGLALTAIGVVLTGGTAMSAWAVVGGLALAAAAAVDATPASERLGPALGAAAVVAAVTSGFLLLHSRASRWTLPSEGPLPRPSAVALLVGAAALVVVAGRRADRPTAAFMAVGLVLGLAAASGRAGDDELAAAAVALGTGAVVAAGLRRGPLAVALVALAAAAGPLPLAPASRLLAAGAVVALVVDRRWALLAAVPGGVSLAAGVLDDGGRLALAMALAGLVVAAVVAWTAAEDTGGGRVPDWATVPALAAGAWLVVAPGSWTWTGATLGAYDEGAALAVAAGFLAVVGSVLVGSAEAPLLADFVRSRPVATPDRAKFGSRRRRGRGFSREWARARRRPRSRGYFRRSRRSQGPRSRRR